MSYLRKVSQCRWNKELWGWDYRLEVEHFPSMNKALSSIPRTLFPKGAGNLDAFCLNRIGSGTKVP